MRALLLAVVLGVASTAAAQAPVIPKVPSAPKPSTSRFELRVSGFMVSGDQSFDESSPAGGQATGSLQGVDFLVRGAAVGLGVRSQTGTFGTLPHVTSADARLYFFPPVFSIMAGAGRRALWSELNADSPSQFDIGIVGVSSTVAIGGSGLRTNIAGAMYLPVGESKDKMKGGVEGEASVLYALPRPIPLFVQIGYRAEVFTSKSGTRELPAEVRGIKIGGGLLLGGR